MVSKRVTQYRRTVGAVSSRVAVHCRLEPAVGLVEPLPLLLLFYLRGGNASAKYLVR